MLKKLFIFRLQSFISPILLNFLITFIRNQGMSVPNIALVKGVDMPLRSHNSSKEPPEVTHWRAHFVCVVGLVFPLFLAISPETRSV